jgi:spore coat polysaccharide biosynthesis predicted glycosyltransferase SpsG
MNIALIVTGGTNLGYGHITRSLTFYKNAPRGISVYLFPVVESCDYRLFPREKNILFTKSFPDLISKISEISPEFIIWDTIDFDEDTFFKLKKICNKHVSISPAFKYMNQMDMVFSRNIEQRREKNVKYYLGMEYAIFNDACKFIPDEIYIKNLAKENLIIGISMGGGDAPNKTLKILEVISELNFPLTIWVLLGEGYNHSYQSLVDVINRNNRHEIILAKTNRSMWEILSNCNVAILAGGLMLVESVYAGLPSINIFEKEWHEKTAGSTFFDKKAAISVGHINDDKALKRLNDNLTCIHNKKSILLSMRENSKGIVDKSASMRIYNILLHNGN